MHSTLKDKPVTTQVNGKPLTLKRGDAMSKRETRLLIRDHAEFVVSRLSGHKVKGKEYLPVGKLSKYDKIAFKTGQPTYVIYSYDTPIFWVEADGTEYMPALWVSKTTRRHQNIVKFQTQNPVQFERAPESGDED